MLAGKQKNLMKGQSIEVCAELKNQKGMMRYPETGNCRKNKPFLVLKGVSKEMVLLVLIKS